MARALGAKLGMPVIEIDAIHWLPNWIERPRHESARIVETAIESMPDGWICDGNYFRGAGNSATAQADTIIWVKMPRLVVMWRVVRRSIRRARDKRRICGENYESWSRMFGLDALWLWHLKDPFMNRKHGRSLAALVKDDTPVIQINSPRELNRFYHVHGLEWED